jgi:hypothetical protein
MGAVYIDKVYKEKIVVCLILMYTTICSCPTSCLTSSKECKQSIELHIPMCYTIFTQ